MKRAVDQLNATLRNIDCLAAPIATAPPRAWPVIAGTDLAQLWNGIQRAAAP
jgi:hypothetical protein